MIGKILLVEDDRELAEITADMLRAYDYSVKIAGGCDEAYEALTKEQYALMILDINLPDGRGLGVFPILVNFASARGDEDDKLAGFEIGGDDYLAKPYSLKELLARVKALMRRAYGGAEGEKIYEFSNIRVDTGLRRVERGGVEIRLALKEFDLLAYLCAHSNRAVKKEELLHEVWGAFSEAEISTVAVHIRWLREKLEEDAANPKLILTVWGVGYKLCTDIG